MRRLTFIIGYSASMAETLDKVASKLSRKYMFRYRILTPYSLREEDLDVIRASDFVLIYSPRLSDTYEEALLDASRNGLVAGLEDTHSPLTNIDPEHYEILVKYLKLGGRENLESLVKYVLKILGQDISVSKPKPVPWHGIFHPRLGYFSSLKSYLSTYCYSGRPLVGILFYRNDWLYGRVATVKALTKLIEDEGMGVVPVFTYGFRDEVLGTPSAEESIKEFMWLDGRPLVDVVINLTSFFILDHGKSRHWSTKGYVVADGVKLLKDMNAPILEYVTMYDRTPEEWVSDPKGCGYMTLVYRISMSEVDGAVEPIPVAATRLNRYGGKDIAVLDDQVRLVVRRVKKWVRLRRKEPRERRVAILLINPPCKGLEANVAVGLGLDVPESVVRLLKLLREWGYDVGDHTPETGEKLIRMIIERKAISEFRWTSVEDVVSRGGALDIVPVNLYMRWYRELPDEVRERIEETWGDPVKVVREKPQGLAGMVYGDGFVVPGLRFGNVVIIPQPKRGCAGPRCDGTVCKILHDPSVPPPHQWLAVYWWVTRVFDADVIIHFGTHGYLEFLPGKNACLSGRCFPLISIDDAPHLYVYVLSNPMEGSIAKRRGMAVILDHLYPPMKSADALRDLEDLLEQYFRARSLGEEARAGVIIERIKELARKHHIEIPEGADPEKVAEEVHRRIHMVSDTDVNLGLHIYGSPPEDPGLLAKYVATIDVNRPKEESVVRTLSEILGIPFENLYKEPVKVNAELGLTNGMIARRLRLMGEGLIRSAIEKGISADQVRRRLEDLIKEHLRMRAHVNGASLKKVLRALSHAVRLAELVKASRKELSSMETALGGGYVEPGPSGNLYRGKVSVLPTGRNFYLIDPRTLPMRTAWELGRKAADLLIRYYVEKHGRYPETVGEVLWSIDAFKADGQQLAQILYLLGVEPVWDQAGNVVDLKVIPLERLHRPRIDVLVRISGIVRDILPNYVELINKAVAIVTSLNEPPEMNYPRKHFLEDIRELTELGIKPGEAEEVARYRVFGSPPGSYGAGVNLAVEASAWRDRNDLSKIWIRWSGYAYAPNAYGRESHHQLLLALKRVDLVNRDHVSDEHDVFGCCCYFAYHGGFYNAAKAVSGRDVEAVTVDSRRPYSLEVRGMDNEIERVVRAKILNDEWVGHMRKHGYRGASEIQRKVLHFYGWASVSGLAKDWMFEEIARKYVLNKEMREWFLKHNKWALEEITRRLIEAGMRGVWRAPKDIMEELRKTYSEIEGYLEGELSGGEVQGGSIDIVSYEDVEVWREGMRKIDKLLEKLL